MAAAVLVVFASSAGSADAAASKSPRVEAAVKWALRIAADDSHGYSMASRWGPDYDCGSFVTAAFRTVGFKLNGFGGTLSMKKVYTAEGFVWIDKKTLGMSSTSGVPKGLKRGDILVDHDRHTELYVGDGYMVGAHTDRGYPQRGDQTGTELSKVKYHYGFWDGVLRYKGTEPVPSSTSVGTVKVSNRTYNGKAVKQPVTVYNPFGKKIPAGKYSVAYSGDLTNAGKVTVTVKGKSGYSGTIKKKYSILPKDASKATAAGIGTKTYTGKKIVPDPAVKLGNVKLVKNKDYKLSAVNNGEKGVLTIKFQGNYKGTVKKPFRISKLDLSKVSVKLKESVYKYSGKAIKPAVAAANLKKNTDYTVRYSKNIAAGTGTVTVTGKNMIFGTKKLSFRIIKEQLKTLDKSKFTVKDAVYTGKAVKPAVACSDGAVTYKVHYTENINAGTAKAVITGTGYYTGTVIKTFKIRPVDVSKCAVTGIRNQVYDGTGQRQLDLALTFGNVPVTYLVKYPAGRKSIGIKTLSITGTGNFAGTVTKTYKICPGKPVIRTAALKNKLLKLDFTEVEGGVKYQIGISNKNSVDTTGAATWKTFDYSNLSGVNSILKKKGTYNIRLRAYKNSVYGSWSNIKAVTVK
jgi:hypothetical protein